MAFKLLSRPGRARTDVAEDWSDFELLSEHERHDLEAAIHIDDRTADVLQDYLELIGFCQQSGLLLIRDLAVDRVSELVRPDVLHHTETDALEAAFAAATRSIVGQLDAQAKLELELHLAQRTAAKTRRMA